MDLIKHFVDNFNINDFDIEAGIYSESTKNNNLLFVLRPYGWYLAFKIYNKYDLAGKLISRKIAIQNSDFLGSHQKELEDKLTNLLNTTEFVNLLNEAIWKEKSRVRNVYEHTIKQRAIEKHNNKEEYEELNKPRGG